MATQRRTYEVADLRDEVQRKAVYAKIDALASSDAFDACEVTLKLQVIHEPARGAKAESETDDPERFVRQ